MNENHREYWERIRRGQETKFRAVGKSIPEYDFINGGICGSEKCRCTKQRVCEILGECLFHHHLTSSRPDIAKQLEQTDKPRKIIRLLEQIMPALTRIGKRHRPGIDRRLNRNHNLEKLYRDSGWSRKKRQQ